MTEQGERVQFFLGANSAGGFASLYEQWLDRTDWQSCFYLKGGAGCGKSTLMTRVAQNMEAEGYFVEYIRCSGDPDSLDGICIPRKKAAVADATSPHVLEPRFPGLTGHYINLGEGYDRHALAEKRDEGIAAARAYQNCYPLAYHCIRAAAEIRRGGQLPLHTEAAKEKAKKRAAGILSREAGKKRGKQGKRHLRFLSGLTGQGKLVLSDTVAALGLHGYSIRDTCGLSDIFLKTLERGFLQNGVDVISCLDPESPEKLEHLLVPELSLGFLQNWDGEFRSVFTESFAEKSVWKAERNALRFSTHIAGELLEEGYAHLREANRRHDALEALYHPFVDFSFVEVCAERVTEEILSLPDIVEEGLF